MNGYENRRGHLNIAGDGDNSGWGDRRGVAGRSGEEEELRRRRGGEGGRRGNDRFEGG